MTNHVEIPRKGEPMKAGWGASVANSVNRLNVAAPANMLVSEGMGGFAFSALPTNRRQAKPGSSPAFSHPWKVYGRKLSDDCDHKWEIAIPSGSIHWGKEVLTVEGVTAVGDLFSFDCEEELSDGSVVSLVVYREQDESGETGQGDEDDEPPKAKIVATASEGEGEILAAIPIAQLGIVESGEGDDATQTGTVRHQYLTTAFALTEQKKSAVGVTSLNDGTGDMDVIGGAMITVTRDGKTIKVSYDQDKQGEDPDPNEDPNKGCDHPGGDAGSIASGGGGGVSGGGDRSGAGDTGCCGGASSTGGTDTGSPDAGVPGKPVDQGGTVAGPGGPNGKETPSAPSAGGSGGTSSGSSGGVSGKPAPLYDGTHTPLTDSKAPLYTGTHTGLTDSKKMNESPFKQDPNFRPIGSGSTTPIYSGSKTHLYSGTHAQLTSTKTMNKSPFAK